MLKNEAQVQAEVRLLASKAGWRLWRNNVGVMIDSRGVPVRYGLANDSRQLNAAVKSADLIGIRPRLITPYMVGRVIGQFVSRECKREGWVINPSDPHDMAQLKWLILVAELGGDAQMTTGALL